jgi:hypothetical protein
MDAILILGLLVGLALAAPRWGRDSRSGLRSKEQELAINGFSWLGPPNERIYRRRPLAVNQRLAGWLHGDFTRQRG